MDKVDVGLVGFILGTAFGSLLMLILLHMTGAL